MGGTRNYGIDLLRIVLMLMECFLHILGQGGVLLHCFGGTISYGLYWLIEVFATCAVNGFGLISGYTAVNKPVRYAKIVEMWFQVLFYSVVMSVVLSLLGVNMAWDWYSTVQRFFPITFNLFWYFNAYFALFMVMPVLNRFLFSLDESDARKALVVVFVMFSVLSMFADPFNLQAGYSALWVIVLYTLGVLARKIRLFEKKSTLSLVLIWLVCNVVSWAWFILFGTRPLIEYVSPTMVISAFVLLILFSRLPVRGGWISKVSPLVFGVYLGQLSPGIWYILFPGAFAFVLSVPLAVGLPCVIVSAFLMLAGGLLLEWLRSRLARLMKIHLLSQKIAGALEAFLAKPFLFLK